MLQTNDRVNDSTTKLKGNFKAPLTWRSRGWELRVTAAQLRWKTNHY